MSRLGLALRSIIVVLLVLVGAAVAFYVYPSYVEGQAVKAQADGEYQTAKTKYLTVLKFKTIPTAMLHLKYGFSSARLQALVKDMDVLAASTDHFQKGLKYSQQQVWDKAERELSAVVPSNIHYSEAQQKLRDNARAIAESYLLKALEALKAKDYTSAQKYIELVAGYDATIDIAQVRAQVDQQVKVQTAATDVATKGQGMSTEEVARARVQVFSPESFVPKSQELKYVEYVQRYSENCRKLADVYVSINSAIDSYKNTGDDKLLQNQLLDAIGRLKGLQKDFSAQYYPYPKGNNTKQVRAILETLNRIMPFLDKAIATPKAGWQHLAQMHGEFKQVFGSAREGWERLKGGDTARNQAYKYK